MRSIRHDWGLLQKYYDIMLGGKISKDVQRDTVLYWDLIE